MLVIKLYRYFLGYVIISVRGPFVERFMNLCARRHIGFWGAVKAKQGILMRVKQQDFHRLKEIAKNSGCRVSIKKKVGLPFLFFRYRKRTALFLGIVFFLAFLFVLSLFVWNVDVVGDESINKTEILQLSYEAGLKSGALRSNIDALHVKNYILSNRDDLSFVGVTIKGSKALLEVQKREKKPNIVDSSTPCNLVAKKTGEITEMIVYEGRTIVSVGQGVKAGDLLVSGVIDYKNGGARLVHAMGEIYANTYYEVSKEVPLVEVIAVPTGEEKNCYSLQIFDFVLNLKPESSIDYENYDKITQKKQIPILNSDQLLLNKDICYETRMVTYVHTVSEAEEIAKKLCDESFKKENPGAKAIDTQIESVAAPGGVIVHAKYTCKENIAGAKKIEYSQEGS